MNRSIAPLFGLLLLASPALAFPEAFELRGQEGDRSLSGQLSFDPATRDLDLQVPAAGVAVTGTRLRAKGTAFVGVVRRSEGLAGALTGNRSARRPWRVRVQPAGLKISVTLTRAGRTLRLDGETPLGVRDATNEALIRSFYEAFARSDAAGMRAAYAPSVQFSDPVFPKLQGRDAGDMWAMLCDAKPQITFSDVQAGERYGVARWVAHYEVLGNPVVNVIDASFEIEDGKIVRHVDRFPFRTWSNQAFTRYTAWIGEGALLAAVRHVTRKQLRDYQKKASAQGVRDLPQEPGN